MTLFGMLQLAVGAWLWKVSAAGHDLMAGTATLIVVAIAFLFHRASIADDQSN